MIWLFTTSERPATEYVRDATPSVTTVDWLGSTVEMVGVRRSVGSCDCAACTRCCTWTSAVFTSAPRLKTAEIVALPCRTVVLMTLRFDAPASWSSMGRAMASRISVGDAPG